MLIKNLGQK